MIEADIDRCFAQTLAMYDVLIERRMHRFTCGIEDAEDLVQEARVRLWRKARTGCLIGEQHVRRVIRSVLAEFVLEMVGRAMLTGDGRNLGNLQIASSPSNEAQGGSASELGRTMRAISRLAPKRRGAIRLWALGFTHAEIALRQSTSIDAAGKLTRRALQSVRAALRD